ncbi:MAG: hypothetical protein ABH823_01310 [bacterium]
MARVHLGRQSARLDTSRASNEAGQMTARLAIRSGDQNVTFILKDAPAVTVSLAFHQEFRATLLNHDSSAVRREFVAGLFSEPAFTWRAAMPGSVRSMRPLQEEPEEIDGYPGLQIEVTMQRLESDAAVHYVATKLSRELAPNEQLFVSEFIKLLPRSYSDRTELYTGEDRRASARSEAEELAAQAVYKIALSNGRSFRIKAEALFI